MSTRFFVLGSLSEGFVHWNKLSGVVLSSRSAAVRGEAWRLKVGFPLLAKGSQSFVRGQLVETPDSEMLVRLLDEFHGYNPLFPDDSLSWREETYVLPDDSEQPVRAWIYYANPAKIPASARLLEDGDWLRSLREEPPLTSQMTERQRAYISRLGAASGREIVPINDLSLYRELMNLELIVDKGRRLALSKLGQEVLRYLE